MNGAVPCPYCNTEQYVEVSVHDGWERAKCFDCNGIFYVEVVKSLRVSPFRNNGKDVDPTFICEE